VGSPTAVPASTASPTIMGSAVLGETLTASPGNWSNDPTGYVWQWLRGGTPIAGARGQTYWHLDF
jgi:hypothetical protein